MGSGLQHSWSSQGWIRVQCLARGHARLQWEAGQQPCVIYCGGQNMGIPSFWPFLFANLWWTDPDLTLLTAPGLALWLLQALSYSVKQQCLHSPLEQHSWKKLGCWQVCHSALQYGISFVLGGKFSSGEGVRQNKFHGTESVLGFSYPLLKLKASPCLLGELKVLQSCSGARHTNGGMEVSLFLLNCGAAGEKRPVQTQPLSAASYSGKAAAHKSHEKGKKTQGPNLLFPLFIPNNRDSLTSWLAPSSEDLGTAAALNSWAWLYLPGFPLLLPPTQHSSASDHLPSH